MQTKRNQINKQIEKVDNIPWNFSQLDLDHW